MGGKGAPLIGERVGAPAARTSFALYVLLGPSIAVAVALAAFSLSRDITDPRTGDFPGLPVAPAPAAATQAPTATPTPRAPSSTIRPDDSTPRPTAPPTLAPTLPPSIAPTVAPTVPPTSAPILPTLPPVPTPPLGLRTGPP